jgi:SAM-dependent methyltransferase
MSKSDSNAVEPEDTYSRDYISAYYDEYGDAEWERLTGSPPNRVNFFIHTHYLRKYIEPGSRVLEIGAGPGRFTQILSDLSCRVVVADVSRVQLELNEKHGRESGFEKAVESRELLDICDLGLFENDAFDAVICYGGPLSYVFDRAAVAMSECARVCKPGGHVLASVMSLWGTCHRFLPAVLEIPVDSNKKITESGDLTPENLDSVVHRCRMYKAHDIRRIAEENGVTVVATSAANYLSLIHDEYLTAVAEDSPEWTELLRMELTACANPGCVDAGTHIIVVGKKP